MKKALSGIILPIILIVRKANGLRAGVSAPGSSWPFVFQYLRGGRFAASQFCLGCAYALALLAPWPIMENGRLRPEAR
jgi:hypothetical protein